MRVLAGALAGRPFLSVLTGDDSPHRPMRHVTDPLRAMGAHVEARRWRHARWSSGGRCGPRTNSRSRRAGEVGVPLAGLQASGVTGLSPPEDRGHTERMLKRSV
jgi:3-phosphoshikimate 1-carboxyvinyltransferase